MFLTLLKAKIHHATVTDSDLNYEGSIAIDSSLLRAAQILPYERVDVLNINNGQRFSTYIIEAPANSGQIVVNGAAARLVHKGDVLIVCAFILMADMAATFHKPRIIQLGYDNRISGGEGNIGAKSTERANYTSHISTPSDYAPMAMQEMPAVQVVMPPPLPPQKFRTIALVIKQSILEGRCWIAYAKSFRIQRLPLLLSVGIVQSYAMKDMTCLSLSVLICAA
jgi:aspartate 1-decarboxylase